MLKNSNRGFKLPSTRFMLFNGAALLIVGFAGVTVLRSMFFHDDAPVCTERYLVGGQLSIERDGQPLASEEFQARMSGSDWGLVGSTRVVKLKSGPAPHAMEFALAKARDERPGIGFAWTPSSFKPAEAACLSYSIYLSEDFDFGKGGRLPGLYGVAADQEQGAARNPAFSTLYAWRADGNGDIHTHLPGHTTGRPLGNDRKGFSFPRGQWVRLDQEVVLNTPGYKDGVLRIWVDGQLRFQKSDLGFRAPEGPTEQARIAGVLSEIVMPGDKPTDKHKIWLSPFELRWR
jgi:hypothetical protein